MKKLVKTLLYVLAITIIMSFSVHIIIADEEADYYSAFNVLVENKNQDNFSSQIKAFINTYGDYISNDDPQITILTSGAGATMDSWGLKKIGVHPADNEVDIYINLKIILLSII